MSAGWSESWGRGEIGSYGGVSVLRSRLLPYGEILQAPGLLGPEPSLVVGVGSELDRQLAGARIDAIRIVRARLAGYGTMVEHAAAERRLAGLELVARMAGAS